MTEFILVIRFVRKTATDVTVSQPMKIIFWYVSMEITVPMPKSSFTRNGGKPYD